MSDPQTVKGIADRLSDTEGQLNEQYCKIREGILTRSDITGKVLFLLPATAHVVSLSIVAGPHSNATTASLKLGKTGSPGFYLPTWDLVANGPGLYLPNAQGLGPQGPSQIMVLGQYTESGTPSTTGGPWRVIMFFTV